MKRILLPLFIGLLAISAQAQIANGGFESWTKVLLFEHPYTGFNDMSSNYETYFDNGTLGVTKVKEDDNTVLRIENVMGSEGIMPGYFIFGKTPTDGLVFGGGNTVFDLNMTGISLDLKYDMREESEGFIIVQFKDGDTPVGEGNYGTGTYFFPIVGIEDWNNKTFIFDYPVHHTANRCVIGLASADLINSDIPYVAGSFLEVDNITFVGSQNKISGGDFEMWQQVEPIMVPNDCVVETHPFSPNYAQSSTSYLGGSAILLKTIDRDDGDLSVGSLLMGSKDGNGEIIPTIEIGEYDVLTFAYSYTATSDLGEAKIVFYNEANDFEQVYEDIRELSPNGEYELIEYAFRQVLQDMEINATHMSIEFNSSIGTAETPAQLGSKLLVDEVNLETALALTPMLSEKIMPKGVRAYPNPTIGRVVFTFPGTRTGYYQVFNQSGAQIAVRQFSNKREVIFDLGSYPAGKYLFQFRHNSGTEFARVIRL